MIEIDDSWAPFLGPLREIAGGLLAVFMVIAVIAFVTWAAISSLATLTQHRGSTWHKLIGIVCCVSLAAAVVPAIAFFSDRASPLSVAVGPEVGVDDPSPRTIYSARGQRQQAAVDKLEQLREERKKCADLTSPDREECAARIDQQIDELTKDTIADQEEGGNENFEPGSSSAPATTAPADGG